MTRYPYKITLINITIDHLSEIYFIFFNRINGDSNPQFLFLGYSSVAITINHLIILDSVLLKPRNDNK